MKTQEIRKSFLDYFNNAASGRLSHLTTSSASLLPFNDATLLFTNAGMVPLKNYFLGVEKPPYNRLTSVQRCVRAGGKHNDLDQVGHTARHHTFFEMLGNFSIGDYFKKEAITLAWNLLTDVWRIPKDRLWISVYEEDLEAADIWMKHIKVHSDRIAYCGKASNFWMMGDVGPCGPCTEIFYDHGPKYPGGPPGSKDEDKGRFVEIWNLVFMQYNADASGQFNLLPKPSVDTGMGLERIAAVLQGVYDNYDIDIFQHILRHVSNVVQYQDLTHPSMRVIADHIRAATFLIADGLFPSNEGRGYVLRRIIRRALRHGYGLGMREPFFYRLVKPVIDIMKEAYLEIASQRASIEDIILQEENLFNGTVTQGMRVFEKAISELSGKVIPGEIVFLLYDTYGFPPDLTEDMAKERGLSIDQAGFTRSMQKQKAQSKQKHAFADKRLNVDVDVPTTFIGYDQLKETAAVIALHSTKAKVSELVEGDKGVVILDRTPFYAESGGQVGDAGILSYETGSFKVENTTKQGQLFLHSGKVLKGSIKVGDSVTAAVDDIRRMIACNHTATHLLQSALRQYLGEKVVQKGSLVHAKRLRFDFAFSRALTVKEIQDIEWWVNAEIRKNIPVGIFHCDLEEAKKMGAIALFGEKYADEVRVVDIKGCSLELCGGTHVQRTGDIGLFKIISDGAIAAGVRRIEALTAEEALNYIQAQQVQLKALATQLKVDQQSLASRISQLLTDNQQMTKQLNQHQQTHVNQLFNILNDSSDNIKGSTLLLQKVDCGNVQVLRQLIDQFKAKHQSYIVILATVIKDRLQLVVGISKNLTSKLNAVELLKKLNPFIDGKGGGRADLAQGSGRKVAGLPAAFEHIKTFLKGNLDL